MEHTDRQRDTHTHIQFYIYRLHSKVLITNIRNNWLGNKTNDKKISVTDKVFYNNGVCPA